MRTGTGRILTTHTGSLPRPAELVDRHDPQAVRAAVAEIVRRQRAAGVDIVNDGEVSKPSYATYVTERLSGFDDKLVPTQPRGRAAADFPEFFARQWAALKLAEVLATPSCVGPVAYVGRTKLEADIANLKACAGDEEIFMSAASPGIIAGFMANHYYSSTEEYVFAVADAMKEEYDAIYRAGIILQLDCPDLPGAGGDDPTVSTGEIRKRVAMRLEALDHATRDIAPDRMRLHMCWGNGEWPHHTDVPLADLIDVVLKARPAGVSFVAANARHEHEWTVFEDVKLPEGKVIIPGVIDSTSNIIEHPDLVAQRLVRYADLVGRTNVVAGSDCGFATFAEINIVDPQVTWAKLGAMADGAKRASERLWARPPRA